MDNKVNVHHMSLVFGLNKQQQQFEHRQLKNSSGIDWTISNHQVRMFEIYKKKFFASFKIFKRTKKTKSF